MTSKKNAFSPRTFAIAIVVLIVAAIGIYWFTTTSGSQDRPLRVRLTWLHQAQFAGVYLAEDNGYYKDHGVDVRIQPGGIEYSSIRMVAARTDDIGMTSADQILLARARGVPVVALAAMYQRSPVVLFSLAERGIEHPEDLRGKRIGIKYGDNTEVPVRALLQKFGLEEGDYQEVSVAYDLTPLIDGRVDVLPGFAPNQPNDLRAQGYEVNLIYLADYDINFYADIIFAHENILRTRPDDVARFVSATLDGYESAIANPEEAIAATLRRARASSREHEFAMLNASIPLWKPSDEALLGHMDLEIWEAIQKTLLNTRVSGGRPLLDSAQDLTAFVKHQQP